MIGAWSLPIAAAAFLLAEPAGDDRAIAVPLGSDPRIDRPSRRGADHGIHHATDRRIGRDRAPMMFSGDIALRRAVAPEPSVPHELVNDGARVRDKGWTVDPASGRHGRDLDVDLDERLSRWAALVDDAARRFNLPPRWILAVMQIESGGQTMRQGRPIRSVVGAMGLMQLMPGTWAAMRLRDGLGDDPDAPADNILAGTAYLAQMHARFGYPGLFAAYHAGPGRYGQYLGGRALPTETRLYVARIRTLLEAGRPIAGDAIMTARVTQDRRPEPPPLFVIGGPVAAPLPDDDTAPGSLASDTDPDDADVHAPSPGTDRARDPLFALPPRP
ncbi:lytic transglycosylase domain-containing protein [Sphingobium yanoikuyae]|uniref:lytic transglycosylase domain-containing protein n=1 Tax=Sphingobium yanoikuyae TaxID=13690 RepID=UPI00084667C4